MIRVTSSREKRVTAVCMIRRQAGPKTHPPRDPAAFASPAKELDVAVILAHGKTSTLCCLDTKVQGRSVERRWGERESGDGCWRVRWESATMQRHGSRLGHLRYG